MRNHPKIFFVRHGETDWNRDRRYQGRQDIHLNETGRAQALRNGRVLSDFLPDIANARYIASPLQRTRETMEIMRAELGLSPGDYETDPNLIELSYGNWEGTLQDNVADDDPAGWAARLKDPFQWRPQAGESYADLFGRVQTWAAGIAQAGNFTQDCVVVSHGGVSRCLRAHILGLSPNTIPSLESPQDRVLILENGAMRWL